MDAEEGLRLGLQPAATPGAPTLDLLQPVTLSRRTTMDVCEFAPRVHVRARFTSTA